MPQNTPENHTSHPLWPLRRNTLVISIAILPIILLTALNDVEGMALTLLLLTASLLFILIDMLFYLHNLCQYLSARTTLPTTAAPQSPAATSPTQAKPQQKPTWPKRHTKALDFTLSALFALHFATQLVLSLTSPGRYWRTGGLVVSAYANMANFAMAALHARAFCLQRSRLEKGCACRARRRPAWARDGGVDVEEGGAAVDEDVEAVAGSGSSGFVPGTPTGSEAPGTVRLVRKKKGKAARRGLLDAEVEAGVKGKTLGVGEAGEAEDGDGEGMVDA